MSDRFRRTVSIIAILLGAGTVLALGQQSRSLRERNRDLITRFTEPHPGLVVPVFTATSVTGDTVTIGESKTDERQVLFFFTTTCEYCLISLPALEELQSALARQSGPPGKLFAIGLDSASAVRRFVESRHLSVPVLLPPDHRISLLYRVRAVPQLMVVDSSGRTVYARAGVLRGAGVLDSIIAAVTRRPAVNPGKQGVVTGSR